jgi:hypothetical protein
MLFDIGSIRNSLLEYVDPDFEKFKDMKVALQTIDYDQVNSKDSSSLI